MSIASLCAGLAACGPSGGNPDDASVVTDAALAETDAVGASVDASGDDAGAPGTDAGPRPLDCTGTWGAPETVVELAAAVSSPAVTADELELFFVDYLAEAHFRVATRASTSEAFEDVRIIEELDAACTEVFSQPAIDVSSDGLRAYFTCALDGPVLMATRASRTAPFGPATTVAPYIERGLSLTRDELAIYVNDAARTSVFVLARASLAGTFGDIAGPTVFSSMPSGSHSGCDLAPDGLGLVCTIGGPSLRSYTRASVDAPFDVSAYTTLPDAGGTIAASPEHTADCRAIYFVVDNGVESDPMRVALRVIRR